MLVKLVKRSAAAAYPYSRYARVLGRVAAGAERVELRL